MAYVSVNTGPELRPDFQFPSFPFFFFLSYFRSIRGHLVRMEHVYDKLVAYALDVSAGLDKVLLPPVSPAPRVLVHSTPAFRPTRGLNLNIFDHP